MVTRIRSVIRGRDDSHVLAQANETGLSFSGDVLLWVDCHDGGFPVLAYVEKVGNIIWWWSAGGQSHLDKSQWKQTRWAKIEPPEGVVGM